MSWLHWYTTNGPPTKGGGVKPFLAAKRRPPGAEHVRPRPEVWYRTPLYRDSHLALSGSTALCGRALMVDELWWIDSGWEAALGPYYLIPDQRKTGQCGPCKTALKDLEATGRKPTPAPTPFGRDTMPQAQNLAHLKRLQARNLEALFGRYGLEVTVVEDA